jgi:hypothetical protein
MAFFKYTAKKLFNGFVSIRDYHIKMCVEKGLDLVIEYNRSLMGVPLEWMKKPDMFQIHRRKFKSKFSKSKVKGDDEYELFEFFFVAGKNIKKKTN